jgi:hypothetical protein
MDKDDYVAFEPTSPLTITSLNRGFWNAMNDLKIKEAWIIAPVKDTYPLENGVRVAPLQKFIDFLESLNH